jgi:hypothetical protein
MSVKPPEKDYEARLKERFEEPFFDEITTPDEQKKAKKPTPPTDKKTSTVFKKQKKS